MPDLDDLDQTNIDDAIDSIVDQEAQRRRTLTWLLDDQIRHEGKHICVRGKMGTSGNQSGRPTSVVSYSVMHSLQWIGRGGILMGSDMDFMKNMIDKDTGKLEIDVEGAKHIRQRAPDWSRQKDLTAYLLVHQDRKFSSILAVLSPTWVDDPSHENWGKDGRALKSADQFTALDSTGQIGLLDLNNTKAYALDGQHRVMGLQGLVELDEKGSFPEKRKDGTHTKIRFDKEESLALANITITELKHMLEDEQVNVEYIPAVVIGETREEAIRRVRSVFFAINKNAKKPDKGEEALLDDKDGSALVGRMLMEHRLFTDPGSENSRVNVKNKNIAETSPKLITLIHINEMVDNYVKNMKKESGSFDWQPVLGSWAKRPPPEELDQVKTELAFILDEIMKLRTFQDLIGGEDIKTMRSFPADDTSPNRGNLLVRSIGLPILIDAITRSLDGDTDESNIKALVAKLGKYDDKGLFSSHKPASVFYGVTYDPHTGKMNVKQQKLAGELLHYLLKGGDSATRNRLVKEIIRCRSTMDGKWVDENGAFLNVSESSTFPLEPIF